MSSRKLSVAVVVIAALVAVTTVLLGSLAALNFIRERDRQWADLRKGLAAQADQLATALVLPVWNFDREQIARVAESQMADREIYGVVIKAGGRIQARVRTASWGVAKQDHDFPTAGLLVERRVITYASEAIGSVTLCGTAQFLQDGLRRSVVSASIVIAVLDVLLVLIIQVVLWRVVLKPLRAIEHFAGVVSSGQTESVDLKGGRYRGELESLRSSIEEMVDLLKTRYAQLRESEQKFSKLFGSTPAATSLSTLSDGRFVDVNQEFERLSGYHRDEIIGRTASELGLWLDPEDRAEYVGLVRETGAVRGRELRFRSNAGAHIAVRDSAELIDMGNETLMLATFVDVSEQKRAAQAREELLEVVRGLTRRLAESEELERQRLSRELHDRVGQNLTALGLNLSILKETLPPGQAALLETRIGDSLALLDETVERVRDVMADLRPPMLDDFGLLSAVRWYAEKVADRTGLVIAVEGSEPAPRLEPPVEIGLFRITQEALTNVVKHAHARNVAVTVSRRGDVVRLAVVDDGAGFDRQGLAAAGEGRGWGLATMQERALAINGSLEIGSGPRGGTQVVVECRAVHG